MLMPFPPLKATSLHSVFVRGFSRCPRVSADFSAASISSKPAPYHAPPQLSSSAPDAVAYWLFAKRTRKDPSRRPVPQHQHVTCVHLIRLRVSLNADGFCNIIAACFTVHRWLVVLSITRLGVTGHLLDATIQALPCITKAAHTSADVTSHTAPCPAMLSPQEYFGGRVI